MNRAHIIKYLTVFTLVVSVTSCTSLGVVSDFMGVRKSTLGCFENLQQNPKYSVLYTKLAIAGQPPTEEQLADTERPSPAAIQAAMDWFEEDQICNKMALENYTNMDREFGARVAGWIMEATDIFNGAMAKTPHYGHINARIKHLRERQKQDVQDWIKAEIKRRQAQMQPATDAFFTSALSLALQALVLRQGAIIQTQYMYSKRVPTYRPVNLTKLVCSFQGKKFLCREDVGQAGIRIQDVLNGMDQIQQQIQRPNPDAQ